MTRLERLLVSEKWFFVVRLCAHTILCICHQAGKVVFLRAGSVHTSPAISQVVFVLKRVKWFF